MMLRNKYILLVVLLFVGAQYLASQTIVLDSVDVVDTIEVTDSIEFVDSVELADAEFEAWLEEYATIVVDSVEDVEVIDSIVVVDSVAKVDFVELVNVGEEARQKEKNALIFSVISSLKKKVSEQSVQLEQSEQLAQAVQSDQSDLSNISDTINPIIPRIIPSSDSLLAAVDTLLSIFKSQYSIDINPLFMDWVLGVESPISLSFDDSDSLIVAIRKGVKDYIRSVAPELYAYHKSDLPSINDLQTTKIEHNNRERLLLDLDSLNQSRTSQLKVDLPEMSKWSRGAKFQVHASQNYISANWYKGGESNLAATMYAMGYFNYDNRKGLQWDNKAEWKLGLYGMASDSLRWLRVNEDLLRLNSKLGYKAFKNFYYTAEWDFQTQFFNTFKSNTYIRTSGPFSPIRMSLSAGIDYKYKSMVSVFVSPLSYKLIYVADMSYKDGVLPEENITHQVGITDGTRQSNQLGALIRTDFDYDFNESIGMEVHFSFFGTYAGKIKGVEIGCEMIGNFKINRFLSAKVSLYPRYDSTVIPADGGKPKMQFYELISLGFNYKL